MKNKVFIFLCVIVFALFQSAYLPELFGYFFFQNELNWFFTLDLLLITLIFISFQRTMFEALVWACVLGLVSRAFGLAWKGSITTSFILLALICSSIRHHILIRNYGAKFFLTAILTGIEATFQFTIGGTFERHSDMFSGQWAGIFWQMLVNGLFAALVYRILIEIDFRSMSRSERSEQEVVFKRMGRGGL